MKLPSLHRLLGRAAAPCFALLPAAVWAQASAPAIPYRASVAGNTPEPQQWLLAVLACGVLLGAMVFVLRRYGSRLPIKAAAGKRVRVMERTVIAHNVQLVVVEYGPRRLLLSVSPTGVACLRDESAGEPAAGANV